MGFRRAYIPEAEKDWRTQHRLEYDIHSIREPVELSGPAMAHNFPDITSWDKVAGQIAAARSKCDVLTVYFHKGYVHRVAQLADYEKPLCHMAVDNGADVVVSSHSHLLRGVELYKGKAIYHGLNAFVMWVPQLSPQFKGKIIGDGNEEWIKARIKRFGFVADPEYPPIPSTPTPSTAWRQSASWKTAGLWKTVWFPWWWKRAASPIPTAMTKRAGPSWTT